MIIFTSICSNYTHKARILAQSVKQYIPEADFVVCLTEREIPDAIKNDPCFDRIVLSRDMWNGNFDRFIFKHSIVEASTAVKAQFFLFLYEKYPNENEFIYLDPDCCVYGPFIEITDELKKFPIILCPHLLHPGNIDMELSSTAHGVYNLGFLAISRSDEAHKMLTWWAERLYLFCYDDIPNGIFTDQKWIDLVPCFFTAKIMHHYGYDLAPWGLLDCHIEKRDDGYYAQNDPIRFVHYSGFGTVAEQCMEKWLGEDSQAFREMYEEYAKKHEENNFDNISSSVWSYKYYHSGEEIEDSIRRRYRSDWDLMFSLEDPFAESNEYFAAYFQQKDIAANSALADTSSLRYKYQRAKMILKDEGVSALLHAVLRKLSK